MSYKLYTETYVSDIASAIRTKNGVSSTYRLSEMARAITDIPTRSEQDMEDLLITGVAPANIFSGEYSNSEVTMIRNSAFLSCVSLTSVNFPECVTITYGAFQNCISLKSVSFPKCIMIGTNAFKSCTSLTSVSFPICTTIDATAFQSCSSLTSINFPMCTMISDSAFWGCSSLATASFPKCTTIGYVAFYGCTSLTSLYIGTSNCVLQHSNAFMGATALSIYVPTAYVDAYKISTQWSYYSRRIVGY